MKYFTVTEFLKSDTADRLGLDNGIEDPEHIANLDALVDNVLDPLREYLDSPIVINSGYRNPEVNKAVGGVSNSQHALGKAADFYCPEYDIDDLFQLVRESGIEFDQCIEEFGRWIHISYETDKENRNQSLLARKNSANKTYYEVA